MDSPGFDLEAFVARSCERQGVPVKVTHARVVADVAALLGAGVAGRKRSGTAAPAASELPDELDSVRVERSASRRSGVDDGAVEDGSDNGGLLGEVEGVPLGP